MPQYLHNEDRLYVIKSEIDDDNEKKRIIELEFNNAVTRLILDSRNASLEHIRIFEVDWINKEEQEYKVTLDKKIYCMTIGKLAAEEIREFPDDKAARLWYKLEYGI